MTGTSRGWVEECQENLARGTGTNSQGCNRRVSTNITFFFLESEIKLEIPEPQHWESLSLVVSQKRER